MANIGWEEGINTGREWGGKGYLEEARYRRIYIQNKSMKVNCLMQVFTCQGIDVSYTLGRNPLASIALHRQTRDGKTCLPAGLPCIPSIISFSFHQQFLFSLSPSSNIYRLLPLLSLSPYLPPHPSSFSLFLLPPASVRYLHLIPPSSSSLVPLTTSSAISSSLPGLRRRLMLGPE